MGRIMYLIGSAALICVAFFGVAKVINYSYTPTVVEEKLNTDEGTAELSSATADTSRPKGTEVIYEDNAFEKSRGEAKVIKP